MPSCNQQGKNNPNYKHGMRHAPEYRVWGYMIQRCTNPNDTAFKNYGGRGITVYDSWKVFTNFYADMGDRPEGLTLERTNNDKGYFPGNCKWATRAEQRQNQRIRKTNTTGIDGVSFEKKRKRYRVQITRQGKRYYLGQFDTLEEAVMARQKWLL